MKKVLSIILSLVLVLCALPLTVIESSAEDITIIRSQDGLWNYYLDGNNNAVIFTGGYNAAAYFGSASDLIIPTAIDGHTVVEIGKQAFYNCGSLTSVTIPDTVVSICRFAFEKCNSLTSISIPDSVASLENFAFSGSSSLTNIIVDVNNPAYCSLDGVLFNKSMTEIICYPRGKTATAYTIPDGVTSIGYCAFSDCNQLTDVTIPDSVTTIGNGAFESCESLTNIIIPDSVTSIGNSAFLDCFSLTSVIIPDSVITIGNDAFCYCTSLTNVIIGNNVTSISDGAFDTCTSLTSITIPGSVQSIGNYAFTFCHSLSSVTIPDGVTTIGNFAFRDCASLTSVVIPDSVISIGQCAFEQCFSLSSVIIPASVTTIGDGVFDDCSQIDNCTVYYNPNCDYINIKSYITDVIISDGVTSISDYAFSYCTSLTDITIPDSVTSIGDGAFSSCEVLSNVIIPDSVTSLGDGAFESCESLTSLIIPDSVTSIGDWTFWGCYSLESIVIPDSVTTIGESAFDGCVSLTSITIPASVTSIGNNVFFLCSFSNNCTVYYNPACDYSSIKSYITDVIIPDGVTSIGDYAFAGSNSLKNVTIPASVTSIGSHAFDNCSQIDNCTVYYNPNCDYIDIKSTATDVIVPSGVTNIGDCAFAGSNSLKNVTIPDSVTSIGVRAFINCTALENITVYNGNTEYVTVNGVLFNKSMTELICYPAGKTEPSYTIPNGVTGLGDGAFESCDSLTGVIIPDSVVTIKKCAFRGCNSLVNILIPDGVTSIGNSAFEGCDSLSDIIIPDNVTSIGSFAFYGCNSLTRAVIPASVTSIGDSAFKNVASTFFIYGVVGSYAELYAAANNLTFLSNEFHDFDVYSYSVSNNEATITGYTGSDAVIIIPQTIDGFNVTGIANSSFENCSPLSNIYIPSSVTSIGDSAFENVASTFSIYGVVGSYAETYANTKNIPFNPDNRVFVSVSADGITDTSSLWSLTDGRDPANNYFSGSIINVVNNGVIQTEDILTLTLNVPNGYGCDGTITNAGVTQRVNDGDNQLNITPNGTVVINLHFYSRQNYTTLYFRNTLNSNFFSQKYPKTETSFIFPENSFTNLHGLFNNWNTASDGSGTAYQPNQIETLPSVDTTYYAIWKDAYFVSFNKNGGTGSMAKIGVVAETAPDPTLFTVPECEFIRNGYAFTGWNTKANGSGDSYQPGGAIILTANTTLYAQWTKAWTVYLHSNFGDDTSVRQEIAKGQTANITANPFTRGGYRFVGWNTAADGSGTSYAGGASLTPTANVHLYAQWERDYDINDDGVEDINDIGFIISASAGNVEMTSAQMAKSDFNGDTVVDAFDAAWLDRLMKATV